MFGHLKVQPLITEEQLAARVKALGDEICKHYDGKPVVVVGVLKGSVIFLADLIRTMNLPISVEFIAVTSYQGTESTGHVQITQDLSVDIKNKHVLLVEDIVDTGLTIDYLVNLLKVRAPASLKVCCLLSKPEAHVMKHHLDFVGFEISDEFVIGYGLDLDGQYRQVPYIAQVLSD